MTILVGDSLDGVPKRNTLRSLWRGFLGRCPACGEGRLFRAYLKVADHCPACGEAMHHQRADDAPPYITMFIVGHAVLAILLTAEAAWSDAPAWLVALIGCLVAATLSLGVLPRVKGALVGLQWSLRMHGFDESDQTAAGKPDRF